MIDPTRLVPWAMIVLGSVVSLEWPSAWSRERPMEPRADGWRTSGSAVIAHDEIRDEIRDAVTRVIPLMQRSADIWFEKRACGSCHHQGIGTVAMAMLHERGFPVDTAWMRSQAVRSMQMGSNWQERVITREMSINQTIGQNYRVFGAMAAGHPETALSRAIAFLMAGEQHTSGRWLSISRRPPLEDSDVTATALGIRTLTFVPLAGREGEFRDRVQRARRWLAAVSPVSTEERTMQLLGLAWAGMSPRDLQPYAAALRAGQREDGGWAQVGSRASDAYATGQALTVLMQVARMPARDAVVQRGLRYLLSTQQADGTWRVSTRRTMQPGLPYFETGFPHGKDQFISYAGSAWALMALASSLQDAPTQVLMRRPAPTFAAPADTAHDGLTPVHRAARYGTLAELRALLSAAGNAGSNAGSNAGADVSDAANLATPMGVTPLMAAVHDSAKVRLLLDAGADMDAVTRQGHTALQLAAAHATGGASARLLLARGARQDRPLTMSNAAKSTALSYAITRGDTLLAGMMLDRGADVQGTAASGESPLMAATWNADSVGADWLLRHGAYPDDRPRGVSRPDPTPLMIASEDGALGVVRALLHRGADVHLVDGDGRTALHYAAGAPDRGSAAIIDALLAAGAKPAVAARDGATPLSLARQYGKGWAVERLTRAGAGMQD